MTDVTTTTPQKLRMFLGPVAQEFLQGVRAKDRGAMLDQLLMQSKDGRETTPESADLTMNLLSVSASLKAVIENQEIMMKLMMDRFDLADKEQRLTRGMIAYTVSSGEALEEILAEMELSLDQHAAYLKSVESHAKRSLADRHHEALERFNSIVIPSAERATMEQGSKVQEQAIDAGRDR